MKLSLSNFNVVHKLFSWIWKSNFSIFDFKIPVEFVETLNTRQLKRPLYLKLKMQLSESQEYLTARNTLWRHCHCTINSNLVTNETKDLYGLCRKFSEMEKCFEANFSLYNGRLLITIIFYSLDNMYQSLFHAISSLKYRARSYRKEILISLLISTKLASAQPIFNIANTFPVIN